MITTPICDFVRRYADSRPARFHMPGHKGTGPLGFERLDITEIDGADDLYAPQGIIAESEANASRLFGAHTFYSTEGSSLAIRAMLALAVGGRSIKELSRDSSATSRPMVLAGRNAHRAFLSAAALLDLDVAWLHPEEGETYHSCTVTASRVEAELSRLGERCQTVYLTSPDYLGRLTDIPAIAEVCRRHAAMLLVDNAHGAYLKFLSPSLHPIDLGADMCCDSAHKTLPALTGAAYLHLRPGLPMDDRRVRQTLALFGSTSPSYIILQSLDACNPCLERFPDRLAAFLPGLYALKKTLTARGWVLAEDEPMKLTLSARSVDCNGDDIARRLTAHGIICEFHDTDFVTLMPSPYGCEDDLRRLEKALSEISLRSPESPVISGNDAPVYSAPKIAMSIRDAAFAPRRTLPVESCDGLVLASPALSCPPCVPIAVCGEMLDAGLIRRLQYYGIRQCDVVV